MRLNIEVKDEALSKRINEYINKKNINANDLMLELLVKFFNQEQLEYKKKKMLKKVQRY